MVEQLLAGRYAELTYSSFDDGISGGGWQVKQVRGPLTDRERDSLRAQVSTQLDAGIELPTFPTPEQIASFPRRLVYALAGAGFVAGAAAWWHTAHAGVDASGRPGNVFSQVVLDRTPSTSPVFRPIDLWRSPSWLTPYGPEQVAAAELGPELPGLGADADVESLIDFCFADFDKIAVLGPLLDACAAALAGGPPVLLAVKDDASASRWIAAVSRLTDALTSRQLYFSSLERVSGLADGLQRGLRLICLPAVDLDEVDHVRGRIRTSTVLLADDEFPELGDLGGPDEPAHPHVTGHGDRIAVTAWSVLARIVLEAESADQARAVLRRLDPIAEQVAGLADLDTEHRGRGGDSPEHDSPYSPDWPLAMAVAQSADVFAEAQPEAARVIGRHSPRHLDRLPELYGPAAAAIATQCGTTTADAWRQLRSTQPSTSDHESSRDHEHADDHENAGAAGHAIGTVLIFDTYLRRALGDHDWLTRADGVPMPDPTPPLDHVRMAEVVDQQLRSLLDRPSVDPVLVARLADVLVRTGLADEPTTARLSHLADATLTRRLAGADAVELVQRIGPLADETLRRVIRPGLVIDPPAPQALGRTLPSPVLDWLYPTAPAPLSLRAVYDQRRTGAVPGDYWLRAERDWSAYARGGGAALGAEEIGFAVWTMLDAGERGAPRDRWQQPTTDWGPCLPLLRRPVDPDDLYWLLHRYEPRRSTATEIAAATLLTVPWSGDAWSDATRRLCRRMQQGDRRDLHPVADADKLPQVREWLAERTWATAWWDTQAATVVGAIGAWAPRSDLPQPRHYATDIKRGVAAVLMVSLISGRPADELATLLQQFGPAEVPIDQELMEQLAAVLNSGEKQRRDNRAQRPPRLVGVPQALAAVMRAEPDLLDGRLLTDGARWVAGFRSGRQTPILEELLGNWIARITDRDRIRQLRDDTVAVLEPSLSRADNLRELDRAVAGKLRDLRRNRSGS